MAFTQNLSKFLIRGIALIARDLRDSRRTLGMPDFVNYSAVGVLPGYTFSKLLASRREKPQIPGAAE